MNHLNSLRASFLVFTVFFLVLSVKTAAAATGDPCFDSLRKNVLANPNTAEPLIVAYAENAVQRRDNFTSARALLLLAELNHLRTHLYKSAFYYQKALTLFKWLGREDFVAQSYVGIGGIFLTIQDFERAETYQRKALDYYVACGDKLSQADILFNIGNIKMNQLYPDSALLYYSVAEAVYLQESNFESLGRLYLVTGYLNHFTGNDSLAIKQEQIAHKMALLYNDSVAVYGTSYTLASIYMNYGMSDSAKIYFKAARDISERIKNPEMEADALAGLSEVYNLQDSVEISHSYLQKAYLLRDSVRNFNEMSKIHKINFDEYETLQPSNKDIIKSMGLKMILGLAGLAIVFSGILFFVRKRQALNPRVAKAFENQLDGEPLNSSHIKQEITQPTILKMNENPDKEINAALANSEQISPFKMAFANTSHLQSSQDDVMIRQEKQKADTSKLEAELAQTKKELITRTIQISQQKEIIDAAAKELKYLSATSGSKGDKELHKILSTLKSAKSSANWEEFEKYFNEVHNGFYKKLNEEFPNLTVNERRLCGLICLNLNNKEISQITNKSARSIEVARYRMRKKMNLDRDTALISRLSALL